MCTLHRTSKILPFNVTLKLSQKLQEYFPIRSVPQRKKHVRFVEINGTTKSATGLPRSKATINAISFRRAAERPPSSISISFFPSSRSIRYSIRVTGQRVYRWQSPETRRCIPYKRREFPRAYSRGQSRIKPSFEFPSPPPFARKVVYSRARTGIEFTGESTILLRNNRLAKWTRRGEEKIQEIAFVDGRNYERVALLSAVVARLLSGVIYCLTDFCTFIWKVWSCGDAESCNVWTTTMCEITRGITSWCVSLSFQRIELYNVIDLIRLWFLCHSTSVSF